MIKVRKDQLISDDRPRALKTVGSRRGGAAGVEQSLASLPGGKGLSEAQVRVEVPPPPLLLLLLLLYYSRA